MPPKHSISDDCLTFGVELEFVLAFHQDELLLGVKDGEQDAIEKDLSYFVRETAPFTVISQIDFPQHAYNSWGINPGGKLPTKPYGTEPQESLGGRLSEQCPDIEFKIYDSLLMNQKTKPNYERWQLLKDHTVCGVGSKNIFPGRLAHRSFDHEPANWDSIGLEAVSEVYNTGDLDKNVAAIKSVVDAVKGKEKDLYGSFITNQCAMHVHVQAPAIEVLQELAILLLIYEEEISRLHPPCRRPHEKKGLEGPRGSVDSNRIFWLIDDEATTPDIGSKKFHNKDRTLRALKTQYHTVQELRDYVRGRDSHENLAKTMNYPPGAKPHNNGNRNRIVNFTAAVDRGSKYPRTIEFRQARGTLCDEEIMHWVKFCIGLVRLVHFYHEHPDEFPVQNWDDRIDAFDLIRDMIRHTQVNAQEIKYWERQMAKYQAGCPGDADDRTDNELAPLSSTSSPTGSNSGGDLPGGGGSGSGSGPGGSGDGDGDKKDDDGNLPGNRGHGNPTRDLGSSADLIGSQHQPVTVEFTHEQLLEIEKWIQVDKDKEAALENWQVPGSENEAELPTSGEGLPDYSDNEEQVVGGQQITSEQPLGEQEALKPPAAEYPNERVGDEEDEDEEDEDEEDEDEEDEDEEDEDEEDEENDRRPEIRYELEILLEYRNQRENIRVDAQLKAAQFEMSGVEDLDPIRIPALLPEEQEVDEVAFQQILDALDAIDRRLIKTAADLLREIINSSKSLFCTTLAHLELGSSVFERLTSVLEAASHLQDARAGLMELTERYKDTSSAFAWDMVALRRRQWTFHWNNLQRRRIALVASRERGEINRRAEMVAEGTNLDNIAPPKSEDTDIEDASYGSRIGNFNATEWEPVPWPAFFAEKGIPLPPLQKAIIAIRFSIAHQFPELGVHSHDWFPGAISAALTQLLEAHLERNYPTKKDVCTVLSSIRGAPPSIMREEDPEAREDYERAQFNLAIVRGATGNVGQMAELLDNGHRNVIYLTYSRVGGRTIWGPLRKRVSVGQASAGDQVNEEATGTTSAKTPAKKPRYQIGDVVEEFDMGEWRYDDGAKHAVGKRRHVTAANAIYDSMVNQYPNSTFSVTGSPEDVLGYLDDVGGGQITEHFTANLGAMALDRWTLRNFKLVVVERDPKDPTKFRATRRYPGDGPELYVKYRAVESPTRGTETRWQALIRKKVHPPLDWNISMNGSKGVDFPKEEYGNEDRRPGSDEQLCGHDQPGRNEQPGNNQLEDEDPFIDQVSEEHAPGEEPPEGDSPDEGDESSDSSSSSSEDDENDEEDKFSDEYDDEAGGGARRAPGAPTKPAVGRRYANEEQGTPSRSRQRRRKQGNFSAFGRSKTAKTEAGVDAKDGAITPTPKGQKRPAPTSSTPPSSKKPKTTTETPKTPPKGQKRSTSTRSSPSAPKKPETTTDAPKTPPTTTPSQIEIPKLSPRSQRQLDEITSKKKQLSPESQRKWDENIQNVKRLKKGLKTTVRYTGGRLPGLSNAATTATAPTQEESAASDAPPGSLALEHMHFEDTVGAWQVRDFNETDWNVDDTESRIGKRRRLCGIRSLLQSMQNQNPDSTFARASLLTILDIFDEIQRRSNKKGQDSEDLQETLNRWTEGTYRLVVVTEDLDFDGTKGELTARRVGDRQNDFGYNVFVRLRQTKQNDRILCHYESMKKKPGR